MSAIINRVMSWLTVNIPVVFAVLVLIVALAFMGLWIWWDLRPKKRPKIKPISPEGMKRALTVNREAWDTKERR